MSFDFQFQTNSILKQYMPLAGRFQPGNTAYKRVVFETPLHSAKEKYRGMFETQKSGIKTSLGEIEKTSITQRLRTDLGRSVREATACGVLTRANWR